MKQHNTKEITTTQLVGLMLFAYLFSFALRLIWVYQFKDTSSFIWNGELMINTNDGYFWASGAQHSLWGMHPDNPRIPEMWKYGTVAVTTFLTKYTPFSLETVILYLPAVISSLVVVPIILIAKLYGKVLWGFLAALLGSIAWSYYNRTMVGYYDTDMFSAMAPMFILYFLIRSTIDFDLKSALYAALMVAIYPFLYDAGRAIIYAIGIIYSLYMIWYHRHEKLTYQSLILLFTALIPLPFVEPWNYLLKFALLFGIFTFFKKRTSILSQKSLMITSAILFVMFMIFGHALSLIIHKAMAYLMTGTTQEGLHFYGVKQTVREAGHIPFSTFANRISGSQIGVLIAFIGYVVLVIRHRAFLLALPLIGIGVFALLGGLRFTVYAVPVAAMSAVYLFFVIAEHIQDKRMKYAFIVGATALMIYPNITHIIGYKVPTVFKNAEVKDLAKLDKIADTKDYTLTWWDYGYPIWFYSDTNTLIDGGKHNNDNFIISKIMQTTSPELAARLSRLSVETYVDSNYSVVANTLFKNGQSDQKDPNEVLDAIESGAYEIPKKTRDVFLYMPYRMMNIFPTVAIFGNLDLNTGKRLRKLYFYASYAKKKKGQTIYLANGIIFDNQKGEIKLGRKTVKVKQFVTVQLLKNGKNRIQVKPYSSQGDFVVLYMQTYRRFIVMDEETFRSMYVQMFMLGKYDKELFELVVSSPYSKIYRLKI